MDPEVIIKPVTGQGKTFLGEISRCVEQGAGARDDAHQRMAENLTEYYHGLGIRVTYLHPT
jgi:excinuclease ABC subunit B